ncbi:hypothetical protein GTY54_26050 [Streptomyces sp. SID625]|nr:hypothetical protein [Streptomyces sp. SID625]
MTSLGINAYLVRRANLIHHERGLDHIRCHVTDGGLIVAPPDPDVPDRTLVARVRVSGGEPAVEAAFTGGYIEATGSPKDNLDLPGRWVA